MLAGGAAVVSIAIAFAVGFSRDEILRIDHTEYVTVAGLFVAALAVERLNELVIAPWIGRGDNVLNRGVLVGSFGLLFGVAISAGLGLSAESLLEYGEADVAELADDEPEANGDAPTGAITDENGRSIDAAADEDPAVVDDETEADQDDQDESGDDGDGTTGWSRSIGFLIAGLAIAGGTKPLHDLISRLEKNVQAKKADAATPSDESDAGPAGSGGRPAGRPAGALP